MSDIQEDAGYTIIACTVKSVYGKKPYDIEVKHNLDGLYASTIARRIAKVDCMARNTLLHSDGNTLLSIEGIKVSPVQDTSHIVLSITDDREDSISYGSYTTKWIDGDTDDTDDTGTLYQFILIEKV